MHTRIRSNGKHYHLIKHDRSKTHLSARIIDANFIQHTLKSAELDQPSTWPAVWASVKPLHKPALSNVEDIRKALVQHIQGGDITLEEDKAAKPSITGTAAKGPASGGEGSGSELGPPIRDASVDDHDVEAQPAAFSESDAAVSEQPAHNKEQAVANTECAGEPISMISGEELLQLTDAVLPGPMPFAWTRTYRSSHSRDCGLGAGWTHSGAERLEVDELSVTYYDAEGRALPFSLPRVHQRSKYIPEGWNLDRLSENGFALRKEGEWDRIFTRPDNRVRSFRLTQMRHPAYTPASTVLGLRQAEVGYCLRFSYNEHNKITRIRGNWGKALVLSRSAQGRVASVTLVNEPSQTSKLLAAYEYDDQGDLIAQRNAQGVGEQYRYHNHLLVQRTLRTGFNFYFEWDGEDSSARCIHNWGDRGIYEYLFTWEPDNNRSRTTDSRGFTSQYDYNAFGQITEKIDNAGGRHQYRYSQGRRAAYIDPEGHTTEYFHDPENNPVGVRDALGNSVTLGYFNGKPTTFIDKDKTHWRREYNRKGQLIALRDPYNQGTFYTYNAHGLMASVVDPLGRKTLYRWSDHGELQSVVDPLGHTRKFTYDDWGQVLSSEFIAKGGTSGAVTRFDYNATGQVIAVTAANGDITSYTYNDNEQLLRYSDPQGRTTEFVYDGLSQVIERIDAEGHRLRYEYDSERNLTAIINEKGESHQFFYDANERLIKEIGFDGRVQHYQYNKAGHLIKHMDAGKILTEYERDALGRMLTKISKAKGDDGILVEEKVRYQYDAKGRLLESYNDDQYLAFDYNRFGKLVNEHHSDLNAQRQRIPASMVDVAFSYIWPGIRSGITLPDGQRIDYQFDRSHAVTGVELNGKAIATIERDDFGREVAREQGELRTESHYDPMGRLQKQASFNRNQKAAGPVQREYGYDKFGNLNHITDGPLETHYVYDLINRLEKVEGAHPEQFHFDPAGNLLGVDGEPLGKSAGNRLAMHGDRKFIYDARGNLIQENRGKDGKLSTHFHYNLQNHLTRVDKDGQSTHYKYDPLGRRIEKKDAFGTTRYLWAGDQLVQEQRQASKKTYLYEPESFKPLAMVQDEQVYHYHLDHLGTPRELTNDSGKVVWKVQYKTYGNVAVKEVEEVENNLRFQGQYFDEETGLHYNRHRYFNPNTGQFISQDPIGLLGGLNGYQYAPNPIAWIDPLGLTCKEPNPNNNDQKLIDDAVAWQGPQNKGYPHKDTYSGIAELKVGDIVFGLYPGQGEYYTTQATVDKFGHSSKAMNEALQVWPSDYGQAPGDYKYRPALAKYKVVKNTRAPIGPVAANTQWGGGGGTQIFVQDYETTLELVEVQDLPDNTPSPKIAAFRAGLDKKV